MSNKEQMNYLVHTIDGRSWYCHNIAYVWEVLDVVPSWVDNEIDLVMLEAIEKQYADTDKMPASAVFLPYTPVAVEVLDTPVTPAWYAPQAKLLEKFP